MTLAPMFAATLASSPGDSLGDESSLGGGVAGGGGVRATQQSLAFTPTQGTVTRAVSLYHVCHNLANGAHAHNCMLYDFLNT